MQSEQVSAPAEPWLQSAKRGGSTLFQKAVPNEPLAKPTVAWNSEARIQHEMRSHFPHGFKPSGYFCNLLP